MTNLLDTARSMMSDSLINQIADALDLEKRKSANAINHFLPAIAGVIVHQGKTEHGAASLIEIFNTNNLDENLEAESWISKGSSINQKILGENEDRVLNILKTVTGLSQEKSKGLFNSLTTLIAQDLNNTINSNNWDNKQLSEFLRSQTDIVNKARPGFFKIFDTNIEAAETPVTSDLPTSNNSSILKWIIPLIMLGAVIWMMSKNGCNLPKEQENISMSTDSLEVQNQENYSLIGSNHISTYNFEYASVNEQGDIINTQDGSILHKSGTWDLDNQGNIIDLEGKVIISISQISENFLSEVKTYLGSYAGKKLSIDEEGNLIDQVGNILLKAGEFEQNDGFFYDKNGNKLGRIWNQIRKALSGATTQTLEAMKILFSKLITKDEGVASYYTLSDLEFNEENHRISSYSKAEVEGLAQALIENEEGRIIVQAFTSDGANEQENKELSDTRAKVVLDMLVTLGVGKHQIYSEGMGTGENSILIKAK